MYIIQIKKSYFSFKNISYSIRIFTLLLLLKIEQQTLIAGETKQKRLFLKIKYR